MIPIPEFCKEAIHTTACIPCDRVYTESDVTGLGLRHVGDGRVCFAVEVRCPRCHRTENLAVLDRPMDLRRFVGEIAELGNIEDFREWARRNDTLEFHAEPPSGRMSSVHHLHTDGVAWSDRRHTELRLTTGLSETGILMRVAGMGTRSGDALLRVLGGYAVGEDVVVLYRWATQQFPEHDAMVKVVGDGVLVRNGFDDALEPSDWSRFALLGDGGSFKLTGHICRKLSVDELRSIVGTRTWKVRRPRKRG